MDDNEGSPEESSTRTHPNTSPSLSRLVNRIEGLRGTPSDGDALPESPGDDPSSPGSDANGSPGFFFPADGEADGDTGERGVHRDVGGGVLDGDDSPDDGFGSDAKTDALLELLGDAGNLLLMGPLSSPADHDLCANLLAAGDSPPDNLLLVTFDRSPDERLNVLRGHLGTLPDRLTILNVGDATRSQSAEIPVSPVGSDDINIKNISNPADIQRIGLAINKYLSDWEGEGETTVCFHSLTSLIRAVPSESVFRFLNVLIGRVRSGEARAHYHVDSTAHDAQTLETYRPLFDETLRFEEDGSVEIDR